MNDTRLDDSGLKRWITRLFVFFTFPLYQLFNMVFLLADEIFFSGYKKELDSPIQVIGNPRSGTTFLHRVLARDEETFVTTRMWQMIVPALSQQLIVRFFANIDKALGSPLYKIMVSSQNKSMKSADKYHKIRLEVPEEDEGFFVHSWASGFLSLPFPHDSWQDYNRLDEWPENRRTPLMAFYKKCIQKIAYQDKAQRRLLSKNPLFCGKIQSIYDILPGVKVVYLVRHPADMLCSAQNMLLNMWLAQGMRIPEGESFKRPGLVNWAEYNYAHTLEVLDKAKKGSYVIVKYDDLVAEPKATVEYIYKELGIDLTPTYEKILQEEAEKAAKYKSKHHYSLEKFDMTHEEIEENLGYVYDRFDFERRSKGASPPPEAKKVQQNKALEQSA